MRILIAAAAGGIAMGGWAVVTVKDVPEYFVAGQRYTIEFQVRQHGRTLMNNVQPRLEVRASDRDADATTVPASRSGDGTYTAMFTAPRAERLYLTIVSGWGASNLTLYPLPIVTAGSQPPSLTDRDRGQMLFVAKGCNACHSNSDLIDRPDNQSIAVGPELGGRHLAKEYVFQKIKHPNSQIMPDLGLSDAEATAVATFVSASPQTSAGRASQ